MSTESKIAWTEATWNPVVGCTKVSPGCANCYAEKMAWRLHKMDLLNYTDVANIHGWTGEINLINSALTKPLHWRAARKIFVCSMGDLFHESVPFEFIDKVFAVMALCPQHTFQVLTKRHERRRQYMLKEDNNELVAEDRIEANLMDGGYPNMEWPLPNVHQLSTICNQAEADKFIPVLLDTPAAVRGISVEPMLGPVDLKNIKVAKIDTSKWRLPKGTPRPTECWSTTDVITPYKDREPGPGEKILMNSRRHKEGTLDWVIIGCESGKHRRRCDPRRVIDLVRQCTAAGVAVFVKQMDINGKVSKNMADWPEECRVQEMPK